MKNKFLVAIMSAVMCSAALYAQTAVDETKLVLQETAPTAPATTQNTGIVWYMIRMFLVLGLILLALYGLYVFLKRKAKRPIQEDPFIKHLGVTQIAPGKSVHVLSLGSKAWLLGVSDTAVTMLAELDDKELIDAMVVKAQEAPPEVQTTDFRSIFLRLFPGVQKKSENPKLDVFSEQRNRIKKL